MKRQHIAALALSAAALVNIAANHEHFRGNAYIPVKGDVPTIGFGTTEGVKMGDKITPERALIRLLADANAYERAIKGCVTAPLYQREYDAYLSLTYNIGAGAFCRSSIPKKLAAGDYAAACETIRDFNGVCVERDRRGKCIKKKVLRGLEIRREAEYRQCTGEAK